MPLPVTKADIVAVWSLAEVTRWAKAGGDPSIDVAISKGWGEIRSAALNRYTAESFDAITADTIPAVVKGYAVDLSTDWLSSGNARADEIETRAARARVWLSYLAGGSDHSFDGIAVPIGTSTGGASVRVGSTGKLKFDPDDRCGGMRRRVTGI